MGFCDDYYLHLRSWFDFLLVKLHFEAYLCFYIQLCYLASQTVSRLRKLVLRPCRALLSPKQDASKGLYVSMTNMLEHLSEMINLEKALLFEVRFEGYK